MKRTVRSFSRNDALRPVQPCPSRLKSLIESKTGSIVTIKHPVHLCTSIPFAGEFHPRLPCEWVRTTSADFPLHHQKKL